MQPVWMSSRLRGVRRALMGAVLCLTACPHTPGALRRIGGTIDGLDGSGLVLQINGGDDLTVPSGATTFHFASLVAEGSFYVVTVLTYPSNPTQGCTVANGSGRAGSVDVANIAVTCSSTGRAVGGTVRGLIGQGLLLKLEGGGTAAVQPGGAIFQIDSLVAQGNPYNVTVQRQPETPGQSCTVSGGTGTAGATNITDVLVVCKAGGFVYVANGGTNDVSGYVIDANSGALFPVVGSPFPAFTGPAAIATDPSGRFVYVANSGSDNVLGYTVDQRTGALTDPHSAGMDAGSTGPLSLAVDVSGQFLYVGASVAVSAFRLDPVSGAPTLISANGVGSPGSVSTPALNGLISSPSASFLYVETNGLNKLYAFGIDSSQGALAGVSGSPFSGSPTTRSGMAIHPQGSFLYQAVPGAFRIVRYALDPQTGVPSPAGSAEGTGGEGFVAIDPSGKFLYALGHSSGETGKFVFAHTIDAGTGGLTAGPMLATTATSMGFDSTGKFAFLASPTDIGTFIVDTASGALSAASSKGVVAGVNPAAVVVVPHNP